MSFFGALLGGNVGPYTKYFLVRNQYLFVTDDLSGKIRVEEGPQLFCQGPYESCSKVNEKIRLNNTEYIYVYHQSGEIDIVEGPATFTPDPNVKVSDAQQKIVLELDEYTKIVDQNTGAICVEKGPTTLTLKPYGKVVTSKKKGYEINDLKAVLVFNTGKDNEDLVTEHQVFFPSPTQEVLAVRERVRLQNHEVMVIVDKEGRYSFMRGSDRTCTFFLPPYCQILEQEWSVDAEKCHKEVKKITSFDLRSNYMDFSFTVRTSDNVEIILDLNFYWQIQDVAKLVATTSDPPEDIWKHAMSLILSDTSRVTMKDFMETFNEIERDAVAKDDGFYRERGVLIHRVEITGRRCSDPHTETIFHDIIKEKTNRIKNIEKKEGENKIRIRELEGLIAAEEYNGKLISLQRTHRRNEKKADGESEADSIRNFLDNLPEDLTTVQKLAIYFDKQNTQRVEGLSKSETTLYITPQDLDIRITNLNYKDFENGKKRKPIIVPVQKK